MKSPSTVVIDVVSSSLKMEAVIKWPALVEQLSVISVELRISTMDTSEKTNLANYSVMLTQLNETESMKKDVVKDYMIEKSNYNSQYDFIND